MQGVRTKSAMGSALWLLVAACVAATAVRASSVAGDASDSVGLARGWGDALPWTPFADAYGAAKREHKPVMIVIWKTWCGACKALRPQFASSAAVAKLADDFVMVNVVDDEEPAEDKYKPDGGYIPRIVFADEDANVLSDVVNAGGNDKYKCASSARGAGHRNAALSTAAQRPSCPTCHRRTGSSRYACSPFAQTHTPFTNSHSCAQNRPIDPDPLHRLLHGRRLDRAVHGRCQGALCRCGVVGGSSGALVKT